MPDLSSEAVRADASPSTPAVRSGSVASGMLKVAAATALFGLAHGFLAGSWAKARGRGTCSASGPRTASTAWQEAAAVPWMPDGQGPVPAGDGTILAAGPFALTCYPLNWFVVPLLWLSLRMTTRLLASTWWRRPMRSLGPSTPRRTWWTTYGAAYRLYQGRVPFLFRAP